MNSWVICQEDVEQLCAVEVVTMGEALIDFVSTEQGVSVEDAPAFVKAAGGAPANVAVGVRRLGGSAAFIGKVGNDPFGSFLVKSLALDGVVTSGIRYDASARTALAFIALGSDGERTFVFFRNPSADMSIRPEEVNLELVRSCRVFEHGSISLIQEPSRSATEYAIRIARSAGALICYDPNIRLNLWPSRAVAREVALSYMQYTDILKISEEEAAFLTATDKSDESIRAVRRHVRPECVVVITRGAQGCLLDAGHSTLDLPGLVVNSVDTTGAGDAFVSGLLVGLMRIADEMEMLNLRDSMVRLGKTEWAEILTFANAVGALSTTKKGAIPALPTLDEVRRFMKERGIQQFTFLGPDGPIPH